jgi:cellulose 1,4-beta-cellobiosidase
VRQSKGIDWNQYVDAVSFAQSFGNRLVSGEPGVDAYVWVKPPGESDGSGSLHPERRGQGLRPDVRPDVHRQGPPRQQMSGALPNAPISGAWFPAQFQELKRNAYPPLS